MTSRNFEDFGIISPRLNAESKKPRSSRARRVRSESKLIKNLHFGIEPLESRIALSISTASYAAYNGSFNGATSNGDSFSIVASDKADNLFLTNTVNGLWASNNSSFFSPVPVAQTTSMYITNATAGSDTNLIPNGYPFLSDNKTMRFMSENEHWSTKYEITGTISYTQSKTVAEPNGHTSTWTFTNWTGIGTTLSPDTLRITSGPGYGGSQISLKNTFSSTVEVALAGWSIPKTLSFTNPHTVNDSGADIPYSSSYIDLLWNTTYYALPSSSLGIPTIQLKYWSLDGQNYDRAVTEQLEPCSEPGITFDINTAKHLGSLGVVPGSLEGTLSLSTGTANFFLNREGQIIFKNTNTTTGYVGSDNDSRNMLTGITGSYSTVGSLHFDLARVLTIWNNTFVRSITNIGVPSLSSLSINYLTYNQDLTPNSFTAYAGHDINTSLEVDLLTPGSTSYIDSPINGSNLSFRSTNVEINAESKATGLFKIAAPTNHRFSAYQVPSPIPVVDTTTGITELFSPSNSFGFGYSKDNPPVVSIDKPTPQTATAVVTQILGTVSSVTVTNAGTNYQSATVFISSPTTFGGAQATATATVTNGTISSIKIDNPGSGYAAPPNITITGVALAAGAIIPATATTSLNAQIATIQITSGGTNYNPAAPPIITITGGSRPAFTTATVDPITGFINGYNITQLLANPGAGFTSIENTAVLVGNPPPFPDAITAIATATVSNGEISKFVITEPGIGYDPLLPPDVYIWGGGGMGATASAVVDATGRVTSLTPTNFGQYYTSPPTVWIVPPSTIAAFRAIVNANGSIDEFKLLHPGKGYSTTPQVTIDSPILFSNASADTRIDAYGSLTQIDVTGTSILTGLKITSNGGGYTSAPVVTISNPTLPGGRRATAVANIFNKRIISVTLIDNGSGYDSPPTVTLSGGGGSSGKVIAIMSSLVGGYGYSAPPKITIDPPPKGVSGSQARGQAIIDNEGRVLRIELLDAGSGYISPPSVQVANVIPVALCENAAFDALSTANSYDLRLSDDPATDSDHSLLFVSASGSLSSGRANITQTQKAAANQTLFTIDNGYSLNSISVTVKNAVSSRLLPSSDFSAIDGRTVTLLNPPTLNDDVIFSIQTLSPSGSIYTEVRDGDINVEGIVSGTVQTYLMNSTASHSERAPFQFTTRSIYTGANTGSIEGSTVQVLLGNETPTPLMGSSVFNIVDLNTNIQSLRVRAGSSQGNPNGPFPYQLIINEKDGFSIDSVSATSFPITLMAGGSIVLTSGMNTNGDVNIIARSPDPRLFTQFVVSAPIVSSVGTISILADTIFINNTLQVASAAINNNKDDISLTATRGDIYLQGLVSSVNNILLDQSNKISTIPNKIYGPSRVRAENVSVRSQGSVQLRTQASTLNGYASTGFSVEELDDINIPLLSSGGIVSLTANGVDPGFSGNNSIALRAKLVDVLSLVTSVPNGTVDINVDTSQTILMGNPVAIQQSKAEEMTAGGSVFIRSKGGDITALDAPLAGSSARQVRVATTSSLDATYLIETPGVYASTLTGKVSFQSINADAVASSFDGCTTFRVGDRVLVKNQTDLKQNGVYTVTAVGGGVLGAKNWQLTRSSDSDTTAEMLSNSFVQIGDGKTLRSAVYQVSYSVIPRTIGERVNSNQIQLPSGFSNYSDIFLNQGVTGTGIATGTKIIDFDSSIGVITLGLTTSVAVKNINRSTNSVTLNPSFAAYSNLFVGQSVSGRGLSDTVTITSFNPTLKTVTLSGNDLLDQDNNPTSLTFGIKVDSSKTTPNTIGLDSTFTGYSALYVGQPVYGQGIKANSVILSINSQNRTIGVTPGSVTSSVTSPTVKVDSSKTTPNTIGLDSAFSGYSALYVGQPVYGQGIKANSVILSINSQNRTIEVTPGSVTSPTDLKSVTFGEKSVTFGVIQGVGSGYITFEMPQLGLVPINIFNPSLTGSQVTWVNSTTLKLPASFSNIERLASSQVISGFGIAQGTTIAEDGINYAERTITLSRPVESQFPKTFSSGVMFRELSPSLASDIGSDSPNRMTTFVVSTNGSSNLSPGGLGKMISLRQTNDCSRNPTNPDQNMDFKFWANNPGNIQLSQELPAITKAFTIDALDRFAGGNTGINSGTGRIIVDGSRIIKNRLNSLTKPTDVINCFDSIKGSGILIDTIKVTLQVNQTSLPPLPLSVDISRFSIGTGVRGDGIAENTTIININKLTRSIEISNGPSRNIVNSSIQFYNINGGLSIKNLTVCGFGSGAAFRIDNADGVIIDRNTIGSNAANARSGNQYGVLVTGLGANLSTISNNTVVGSTIAAIRIEAGASNTRLVGNTVGKLQISNQNGIELVSDNNSVGVNPIEPNPVVKASVPLTMNSFGIILPSTLSPSGLASIRVGLGVFGDGIRTGTTILSLDTSTREIILSNPVTLSTASSDIFFGHLASTSITSNRVQLTSWPVLLNLTAGSKTVTLPWSFPTKALSLGKTVYGDGIADGTTISTINGFIITLSKNIVRTVSQSAVSFENSIPLENLYLGQSVTGVNFDSGTTITNIDIANRTIWLSKNPISEGYGLVHFVAGAKNTISYNVNGIVLGTSFLGNLTAGQKQIAVSSTFEAWSSITVGMGVSYPNVPLNTTITKIDQDGRTITLNTTIQSNQLNTRISFNIANNNIITNTKIFNNSFDGIVLAGGSNNTIGTDAVSAVVTKIDSTTSVRLTSWPVAVQLKNTSPLVSIPASFKDFSSLKTTMRVYGQGIATGTTIKSIDQKNKSITLSTKPLFGFVSGISTIISTISFGLDATATFTTAIPWNSLFIGQTVTSTSSGVNIISMINTGYGYTSAPLVTLTGGGGIGATAIAEFDIVTKSVTRIRVTNPGTGYTSAPMVRVSGGGNATNVALAIAQLGTGIPEYTSIVAINTAVGYITLSPPQAGQSSFYLNDFSATLTFALRTQTSNAIYGNGGWGINILVENKNLIARNYFNTESPGTATVSSNKKGVIGSNSFRALAYIPGELSQVDSYGNQHGAASQNYTPGGGGSGGGGSGGGGSGGGGSGGVPGTIPKPPVIFPY